MLSNTSVSLCGIPNPDSILSFLSFLSLHNVSVKPWSPHISALIVGDECAGKWKYSEAQRLGIRILTMAEAMPPVESDLWVTKYAPRTLSDVIGHVEPIKTLTTWLTSWSQTMTTPRAALLTGPPGIGKTTLAHLVAAACDYDVVELNASNERSAGAIRKWFEEASRAGCVGKRRVVIMDEVDGMSSGDRGGMGELARVIRGCAFPMICIGNERTAPKMRPLVACCLDVRCARPPRGTIAKRLLATVVAPNKLNYTPAQLEELCERNGNDIRQILNFLQFDVASGGTKDELQRVDPFSATGRLFGGGGTLDQRLGLVFVDFGLVPLMVAEGYVAAAGKRVAGAIDRCVSAGHSLGSYDIMDRTLRRTMNWGLLPSVVMNIVATAAAADGPAPFQIFPSWLGKNSKRLKHRRMLRTLRQNGRFGNDMDLLDSRSLLRARLFRGTATSATSVVDDLVSLGLTRDDMLETLVDTAFSDELGIVVDSKLKGGITREWKKRGLDKEVVANPLLEDAVDSDEEEEMPIDY
jgi:replication factor C subunit 1